MRRFGQIIIFLFLFLGFIKAQYNNRWYFANGPGLNFNTASPTILTNGAGASFDHVSTISDASGNLLFFTDGMTVWNKNFMIMTNGSGLIGTNTAGQCALIVPIPCDPNRYVIFQNTDFANPGQLHYSVVDMSMSAGLGAVVAAQKNVSLGTGWTEKLCAYYNPNGNNYWVVAHKWNSNQFVAFKVDATTIATSSVVSSIGSVHNCGTVGGAHDAMGQLTISPDGTKLINALTCQNTFELFDFNSNTGVLSNSISIASDGFNSWGTAFSPDSKKIYVNTIFGSKLYQYDITTYNQAAIVASQYTVYNTFTAGYSYGYLELGPDGRVYVTRPQTAFASIIGSPNNLGAACNYTHSALNFSPKQCLWGLSRIAYNIAASFSVPITYTVQNPSCNLADGSISITPVYAPACTYSWLPGNQTTSVVTGLAAGNYTLIINNGCVSNTYSFSLGIPNTLSATASPTAICSPAAASASLIASGVNTYTWEPGTVIGASIVVSPTATTIYTVSGTNTLGCTFTKTLNIFVGPSPTVNVSALSTSLCSSGPGTTLTANGATNYTWLPSMQSTSQIAVNPGVSTTYTVVGFAGNCTDTKTINIIVDPTPTVTAVPSANTICAGQNVSITASGAQTYTWITPASTNTTIVVAPIGSTTYTVAGTSSVGCTSSNAIVFVFVNISPTVTANPTSTTICDNQSYAQRFFGATSYTWLPGPITGSYNVISPTVSTIYTVTGSNIYGCLHTITVNVTVNPSPTISILSTATVICSGANATLTAGGASSYVWFPGSISANSIVVSPTTNLVYTVIGTNSLGCATSNSVQINVFSVASLTIAASDTVICQSQLVNLTAAGAQSYTWSPGGIVTNSITATPLVSTTYTILGTNQFGCSASKTISIIVNPLPNVSAAALYTYICAGSMNTLTAQGANSYTWLPLGSQSPTISLSTPSVASAYTVIGSDGVCSNTAVVNLVGVDCNTSIFGLTKAADVPVVLYDNVYKVVYTITAINNAQNNLTNVNLIEDLSRTFPAPVTFSLVTPPYITSQASGLTIYSGFDGRNQIHLTDSANSVLFSNKRDTIVLELAVDPHGFGGPFKNWIIGHANYMNLVSKADSSNNGFIWDQNGNGTPIDDNAPTIIKFPLDVFIPEVITPNADGKNDRFVIRNSFERPINLTIFNRWGTKVYHKENYDNSWEGYANVNEATLGNGRLPQATYFYIVEFTDAEKQVVTGFVVLQY